MGDITDNKGQVEDTSAEQQGSGGQNGAGGNSNLSNSLLGASLAKGETNYKEELERLRGMEHKYQVEAGRLKKVNEDYKSLKKQYEELQSQIKSIDRKRAADYIPTDVSSVVDDDVIKAGASMVEGAFDELDSRMDAKLDNLRKTVEMEREARVRAENEAFDERINTRFPGFAEKASVGGEYGELWGKFLDQTNDLTGTSNRQILEDAYDSKRISSVIGLVKSFKKQNGIKDIGASGSFPDGQSRRYVPSDYNGNGTKRTYSLTEYKKAMADSRAKWERKEISAEQRRKDLREFEEAYSEGRVTNDPRPSMGL